MTSVNQVTFKNAPATLTINADSTWTLVGTGGNAEGKNVMSLLALMEDRSLSMTPYARDPTAAAAAAGGRRKTRKSRARKTRRYRK